MRRIRNTLLALVVVALAAPAAPAEARAHATVSVGFFYDSLAPHGQWIASAEFGHVWRPLHVGRGWRPYYEGQWIYTDFGWTFVSHEPWGWATYHYGRWYVDPYFGWVWVPGYEWAPAWVVFHHGPGWIGWAPLPPRVSLSVAIGGGVRIDPRAYCFVEERHFVERRIRRHVIAPDRNAVLLRSTRNVTSFSRSGERYVNRSLPVDRVQRVIKRRIEAHRIVDVPGVREMPRARVERDEVRLFRPQVSRQASPPPKRVVRSPARGERGRGQAVGAARGDERGKKPQGVKKKSRERDRRKPPPGAAGG